MEYYKLGWALDFFRCNLVCKQVGFHDPWMVMLATTNCKQLLAILTTIQWLKVIKYVNGVVPKFALATSVLSHGLADLLMFFLFFLWSIVSFAQLFFMQLGPYMEGYATLTRSGVTLFRALFGDFDIDAVLNTSASWANALFMGMYLFVAVFILLSIFLTILGEHQGYVREDDPSLSSWGVLGKLHSYIDRKRDIVLAKLGQGGSKKKGNQPLTKETPPMGPIDTPPAVSQLASLGKASAAFSHKASAAFSRAHDMHNNGSCDDPVLWKTVTKLEKLDEKTHELLGGIEELQMSGDDPEKLIQLQDDLAVVKQLQTARLIQKAEELQRASTGEGPDTPEDPYDAPRRYGLFGTMPQSSRGVDTKALAHDVAKIKAMLSKQEAMLKRLLGESDDVNDSSSGAIATMRLHGRSRQSSGIRTRISGSHTPRNGPSQSVRSSCSVRTDPGPLEPQRAPAMVLRRTSPDSERTHGVRIATDGMSSVGGSAAAEPGQRRQTSERRRREHTSGTPPTVPGEGGEQISPGERSVERRSGTARSASVFSTGV